MDSTAGQTKPLIVCLPYDPYYLIADSAPKPVPHLKTPAGKPLATVAGIALCRCGGSNNKPFCDGSHKRINFKDDRERAVSMKSTREHP